MKKWSWGVVLVLGWLPLAARGQSAGPVPPAATKPAGQQAEATSSREDLAAAAAVFEWLANHLRAIPRRWDRIAQPLVLVSDRTLEEILSSTSEEETRLAQERILRLAGSVPSERKALIERELRSRPASELDLWLPGLLAQELQTTSLESSALLVDTWLDWAETLGRKDVLLFAAGIGIDLISLRKDSKSALEVASLWTDLAPVEHGARSRAVLLNSYAACLLTSGEIEKSLSAYQSARKLYGETGDRVGQGNAYTGEADVLFRLGENEKSLAAYRSARKLFEEIQDRLGQGNTFVGEAHVLALLGENEKSLAAYRSARKLYEEGDRGSQGYAYHGEAVTLFLLGENKESLAADRSARKLFEEVGDRAGQGYTYEGEAEVLFRLKENEKSLAAYRSALKLFQEVGDRVGKGNAYNGEARVLLRLGEGRKAADLAAQAIEDLHNAGAITDERGAWLVKAEAEALAGSPESAAIAAEEAIRLHEHWRVTRITEAHRVKEDEQISAAYDILVPIRLGQGRVAEGLARAEEARSHVLLDLLAPRPAHREGGSAIDLLAERERLESELARVEVQIQQAFDSGRQEELREQRRSLDRDLEWNSYLRVAAEKDVLPTARSLDAAAIQSLASETGPILLYYATNNELIGFLVLPGATGIFTARIEVPFGRLEERVHDFAHDQANPLYASRARSRARELWDLLIRPFAQRLPPGGPLVIVPHGPLHELPFEALLDPSGSPLFLRWEVSVAPSASSLALARGRHKEARRQDSFLAFSSGRGLDLPEEEAGEIARLFDTDQATFRPTEARFESYERLVTRARHLLIATNGVHVQGNRRETYLEIEPTREVHDSRLSAAEIAALPLEAELVTLAACDTAQGAALLSDERLDLTRAFLIAGAAAVLATRWKVPESRSTSHFLLDFYRAYREGGPEGKGLRKDRALSEARRRSRERGDPAQVWAAWVLVGDAR